MNRHMNCFKITCPEHVGLPLIYALFHGARGIGCVLFKFLILYFTNQMGNKSAKPILYCHCKEKRHLASFWVYKAVSTHMQFLLSSGSLLYFAFAGRAFFSISASVELFITSKETWTPVLSTVALGTCFFYLTHQL